MKWWSGTGKIGVFWDGPTYHVCLTPWRWLTHAISRLHLVRFPLRMVTIKPVSMPPWCRVMRCKGFWQLRLWTWNWTLRISLERKNDMPGPIAGGWSV